MRSGSVAALGLILIPAVVHGQESGAHATAASVDTTVLPTPVETAEYLAYTDFDEMEEFLSQLALDAPELTVDTVAALPGERPPAAQKDPALILVSLRRTATSSETEDSVRVPVLIIASQHGDEQSGKEATLRIVRDLAVGRLNPLLDHMDVYAVPMPNPWGTATGQRENSRGQDLNRDHTRLGTPSVAALHELFRRLQPAVVIDMHELGLAAYDSEIGLATHPNADSALIKFGRYRIMPYVANELAKAGFSFHEYVTATPEPGAASEGVERYFTYGPLLASYARNAFALRGAISMLFEAASSRDIQGLERRTEVHVVALRAALEVIASAPEEIRRETTVARQETGTAQPVALAATYETDPEQPVLTWLVREPTGINTGSTDRWKPAIHVRLTIDRPAGYLIPAAEREIVAALLRHGFRLSRLEEPRRLRVGRYPLSDSAAEPFIELGVEPGMEPEAEPGVPIRADDRVVWEEDLVPAGTYYVDLAQPADLLVAAILEPWSLDAWYSEAEQAGLEGDWYPVMRVESPIESGVRAVPSNNDDGILGGP